ncbi:MAG: TatD family hydrolase [Gammaproteobacteria bacterium]|nr:TatD family hydrolase [Gammaproteobacteria bacterium]
MRITEKPMELFDSHCHLDVAEFDADRAAVLARARAAGVGQMVVPAVAAAGWPALLALCRGEAGLYPALGLHPLYLERHREADLVELRRLVERERPLAIGEIGLDYFVAGLDRGRQQWLFEQQLALAEEFRLPVLLHVRKAHDPVLQTLRRFQLVGGIAHAFNGSAQQAQHYIELGFKLGFGGMLTYERSTKIRALAGELPLEAIVLETDAPDMTPLLHHGERNSPEYLPEVLQALAQLRGVTAAALAPQLLANTLDALGMKK